jgi:hypothetical protein
LRKYLHCEFPNGELGHVGRNAGCRLHLPWLDRRLHGRGILYSNDERRSDRVCTVRPDDRSGHIKRV